MKSELCTENLFQFPMASKDKQPYRFIDAFDCFFKLHKVFHINYHPHIKNLMIFIDRFIFKNAETTGVSNKMLTVANNIFKE